MTKNAAKKFTPAARERRETAPAVTTPPDGSLVSILVPTYNGELFLRQALRSALRQTYENIEILVGVDA